MPSFTTRKQVFHDAKHMFELVADVEKYPQFVPMCDSLIIRDRKQNENKTLLIADMTVGYKLIRETFTSQVLLNPDELAIDVKYVDGPFRYLDNRWRFYGEPDVQSSEIEFFIDYEFKSRTLGILMGSVFDMAFRRFTAAFETRADEIYGKAPQV